MSNNPQNTPARQTKKTLLFVILAGVLAMLVGIFIQNREDDTPKVGFAANQERYSGPDWDAYEAGYTMARPNFGNAEVPASATRTDDSGTLAGALRADTANAVWWCDNNMPDDLVDDHSDEIEALYGGCVDGLLPDAAGRPSSYGVE